ncbi:Nickel-binding periplasmic protein precursor [Pseudodesulfovibrio hydrargyri]|uniref:Nickel-binding periplasmic protein n=1 Tax=Pseudodesulfovibrio hydrargyri TaxID=2125990 RepID=A0A1J5MX90_9BACT|nr:nickel ABC transporter substrate-binding protein [Pseudodesulfovibrio hydrargyri]OIQ50570.1 Nickel-binding periplasmic protein precursor [Pseudodesulfovibrio hydrargyri]
MGKLFRAIGMFRRLLTMTAVIALTLFSALPGVQAAPPEGKDVLVYSWNSNMGEFNPHLYSPNQMFSQNLIYEPLVRYQADGMVAPCLAQSWSVSTDGREYTFKLRQDVRFTDGRPFNAEAVKRNIDAVLQNHQRHEWLELTNQLWKAKESGKAPATVVDEYTVRLTLHDPYYPALQELALIRPARFLSPAAMPEDGNTAKGIKEPVGTGPWKLVEAVKSEYALLERNEGYWGDKAKSKYLLIKIIPDTNARVVAFETGQIDIIYGGAGHGAGQIGLDSFERYRTMPGVVTDVSAPLATRALALNTKRFPTDDIDVRRAILLAVDRDALVKHVFLDVERKADTLFSPTMPYCDLGLKPYGFDRNEAEALLEKAGWTLADGARYRTKDGKELALDLCFAGNDTLMKSVAEVVQGDLRKVGVKVNLVGEEKDSNLARQRSGEFGMIFGNTWGAPYDPHSFVSSMRVPSHADYQAQLGLPMKADIDKAIGEVLISVDETRRRELYQYILSTLHDQAVYMPLTYMTNIMVHRDTLEGAHFGATKNEIPLETMYKR